mmetsp:Transcript_83700/g.236253  ORF Transcript_83700/g.236253 Transcript_83700/m.236253 type:complete len:241 (-) Transcript_83700:1247-1969(-)
MATSVAYDLSCNAFIRSSTSRERAGWSLVRFDTFNFIRIASFSSSTAVTSCRSLSASFSASLNRDFSLSCSAATRFAACICRLMLAFRLICSPSFASMMAFARRRPSCNSARSASACLSSSFTCSSQPCTTSNSLEVRSHSSLAAVALRRSCSSVVKLLSKASCMRAFVRTCSHLRSAPKRAPRSSDEMTRVASLNACRWPSRASSSRARVPRTSPSHIDQLEANRDEVMRASVFSIRCT